MTNDDLLRVNRKRQGESYSDSEAARTKRGTVAKQPLLQSPFVQEFEYGVNGQGYWDYAHMILQMEDCVDVLI